MKPIWGASALLTPDPPVVSHRAALYDEVHHAGMAPLPDPEVGVTWSPIEGADVILQKAAQSLIRASTHKAAHQILVQTSLMAAR